MNLKNLGSVLSSAGTSGLSSFAQGLGSGMSGAIFGGIQADRQWEYDKKRMALQNQYNVDMFNRERSAQLSLLANQSSIMKNSLRNAGYSTADPEGAGTTLSATAPHGNGPAPGASLPSTPFGPSASFSPVDMAQVRKLNAEADAQEITNRTLEEKNRVDIDLTKAMEQLQKSVQMLNENQNELFQETKEWRFKQAKQEYLEAVQRVDNLIADNDLKRSMSNKFERDVILTNHQIQQIDKSMWLMNLQGQKLLSAINVDNATVRLFGSQEALNDSNRVFVDARKVGQDILNKLDQGRYEALEKNYKYTIIDADGDKQELSAVGFDMFVNKQIADLVNAYQQGDAAETNAASNKIHAISHAVEAATGVADLVIDLSTGKITQAVSTTKSGRKTSTTTTTTKTSRKR